MRLRTTCSLSSVPLWVAVALTVCCVPVKSKGAETPESKLVALIESPNEQLRSTALQAITSYDFAYTVDYDAIIPDLIRIVRQDVRPNEEYFDGLTSRNLAIRALGKLNAREAVPLLIEWMVPKDGQNLIEDRLMPSFGYAGYALIEIGNPAVGPLISRAIQEGNSQLGKECVYVAVGIIGINETRRVIKLRVADDKNANQANADGILRLLRKPDSVHKNLHKRATGRAYEEYE